MFGDVVQMRIDLTEERDDKIDCGHGLLRVRQSFALPASLKQGHDNCNVAHKSYSSSRNSHHRLLSL